MTEKKSYEPGEFCWTELATNDWKAAKQFYGSLFGWTANEIPMGDHPPYVMLQLRGKNVGALYENKKAQTAWLADVDVGEGEDASAKPKTLRPKVPSEPVHTLHDCR